MKNDHRIPANRTNHRPSPSKPGFYSIRIKGFLDPGWDWLENMTVTHLEAGETRLCGRFPDQAALHGLLARLRDMNLTLLAVNWMDPKDRGKEV